MVVAGELFGDQLCNGLSRFLCENRAVGLIQPFLLRLLFHIHEEEIALSPAPDVRELAFVDPMGVQDDPALHRLSENPCEAHDRKTAAVDEIPQYIAGPDAGQLVDISDQNQRHGVRNGFQEMIHQHDVDHRALVNDQNVTLQRVFFVFLVTFRRLDFQEAVNGLRLHMCRLGETFGRASGGRCQQNPGARRPESGDDAERRRGFAGAGTAGQQQDFALNSRENRLHLDFIIGNAGLHADLLRECDGRNVHALGIIENGRKALRRTGFREIERRQINGFFGGFFRRFLRRAVFGVFLRDFFCDHLSRTDHLIQCHGEHILIHAEQLRAGFQQLRPRGIAVPLLREAVQRIEQAAPQPDIFFLLKAQLFGDGVGGLKADAPDIVGQPIGIFLHDLEAVGAVGLEDSGGVGGGNVVALQEKHDVFDFLLLFPAL